MTEHQKLKEICDKIGYEINPNKFKVGRTFIRHRESKQCTQCLKMWIYDHIADIREIIFTQEFMDKYSEHILWDVKDDESAIWQLNIAGFHYSILKHLNDPVGYLYNLIKE